MLCEFSIAPIGSGESLGEDIALIIDIIDRSGMTYQTHAMGTLVEGDWESIMNLIRTCRDQMKKKYHRISIRIAIDDRDGVTNQLRKKVEILEEHMGRHIQK